MKRYNDSKNKRARERVIKRAREKMDVPLRENAFIPNENAIGKNEWPNQLDRTLTAAYVIHSFGFDREQMAAVHGKCKIHKNLCNAMTINKTNNVRK